MNTTMPAPHFRPLEEDGDRPSIRIFYSYADADKKWLTDLSAHLNATPGTDMNIQEFYRGKTIIAGENEDEVIRQQVQQAHLILLLITSTFMNEFLSESPQKSAEMQEISQLLKEARVRKVFIPILVDFTDLSKDEKTEKVAPFVALKRLPANKKPIREWKNKDEAFKEVVQGIKEAIEDPKNRWIFRPFSTLPPRNPVFTGRVDLLIRIQQGLKQRIFSAFRRPLAVFGLGGVGKTQLAIEYAYRNFELYQNIFLVHANNLQTLTADYATIARALGLVRSKEPDAELIKERMKRWLENNDKWLLIFDNADNEEAIKDFIPDQAKGEILLTTQNTVWGKSMGTLEIKSMQHNEGATLLLRRAGRIAANQLVEEVKDENEQNLATGIAGQLLGGLPLAIDQAGAFIKEARYSLSDYKQLYQQQQQRIELLKRRGIFISPDDHSEPVFITFSIAFKKVAKINPLATDLLRLCAFLAPDDIPEELITRHLAQLPSFSNRVVEPKELTRAREALASYSLINADTSSRFAPPTMNIHRLVQTVLRDSMNKEKQRTWAIRAVNLISLAFPTSIEVSTWPQCQMLLPHVQICAQWIEEFNLTTSQVSQLLDDSGYYLFQRGLYREAKLLIEQALRIRQRGGARDIFVAQSLHRLGEVNEREGNYADAEQNLQQALEIREQQDQTAAYTADSLKSLAEVYRKRKKYTQAKQLYEQALKIYEQTLAKIDPQSTASAFNAVWNELVKLYNNLALLQQDLREFDRADELYYQALKMAKNAWGEENPTTAQILHDQAELYKKQGKLEEAERLHLQALDIRRWVEEEQRKRTDTGSLRVQMLDSGELNQEVESRDIAMSLNSLGTLYMRQGKREKAEEFYKNALKMRKKILGSENPETAESRYGLGRLYRYWNRAQESEENYRQALKIQEKRPGLGDSATLDTQKALADLYQSRGREAEAEEIHRKGLNGRYEQLRLDDFTIKKNLEYLAKLYQTQHKPAKEVDLYKEAFSKYAKRFGPDDALTQEYRQKLLDGYKSGSAIDGNLLWLYTRDFDLRARYLRRDNSQTIKDFIQSVKVLADLYNGQHQTRKLKELYDLALHICHQQLGANHPVTLWYQNALLSLPDETRIPLQRGRKYRPSRKPVKKAGNNTTSLSDTAKAPEIAPEQVQDRKQKLEKQLLEAYKAGIDDAGAVKRRRELIQFYEENGEPEKAEHVYRQALNLCLLDLGPYHMTTLECQNELARCYWQHEKYDEAKPLIQEVLVICQPMLEEEDNLSEKDILTCIHSLDNAAFLYLRELDTRQLNIRRRYWLGGEPTKAEALLQQALDICRERLGEKHAETITIRERYAALLREMGLYDKAEVITIATSMRQEKAEENNQPAEQQVRENNQLQAKN